MNDLRYALRTLARTPGFTAAALIALALGIGANTAVFSVVEGVLLRSLPFPDAARLVDVKSIHGTASFQEYEAWRSAPGVFEDAAAARGGNPVLLLDQGAERVTTWAVTANFLPLLGARPVLGRGFFPDEDHAGAAPVAVLSYDFWQSRLGGDPHVLGRTLSLDATRYSIVGVLPRDFTNPVGFHHRGTADVWLALGSFRTGPRAGQWLSRPGFWVIGRLRPGVTPAEATGVLNAATRQRGLAGYETVRGPFVTPLHEYLVVQVRTALLLMLGAVALVALVACANVATLLLCRGAARGHEVAVRVALGASRRRLVRQVLTESVLLALGGGAVGVLLAFWAVPMLVRFAGAEVPGIADIGVNTRVLGAALVMSVLAGLVAGLAPALRAARQAPGAALKAVSATGTGRVWRHRASDAFIVAQVALTMMLLAGAGLLGRSFLRLMRSDPGFQPATVVAAELDLLEERYASGRARLAYLQRALERVRALPGVTAAAAGSGMPLAGGAIGTAAVPGQVDDPGRPLAWITAVSTDFFGTLGITFKRGQLFGASQGVIIDDAAARAYFPGQDPLGKAITFYGSRTRTIVGVVGDTRQQNLHEPAPPHIYALLADDPPGHVKILARTAGDPSETVQALRRAIQGVDPSVPIDRVAPMRELRSEAVARQRFYTLLVAVFAAVALALAASGVFGVAAYAVARRTQEIGVRVALGADRRAVRRLILSHGLGLAVAGIGLGVPAALATTRVLRAFLFEIGPRDPVALASVALLLFVTVLVACYVPARRATRVDPMVALRYE